jgi:hypothetical protein
MPFEMVADKIAQIAPEYQGELLQFIDFLLVRQNEASSSGPANAQEQATKPKRRAGGLEGGFYMAPDFDEPLEDFADYM